MRKHLSFFALSFSALLIGCQDSSSIAQLSGLFIDDPVSGLTYTCSNTSQTLTGVTDDTGKFNYPAGGTCTFKVGNVTLGAATSVGTDGKVTPQDVAGVARTATNAGSAVAIAQFLQSLNDGSTGGKIVIPAAITTRLSDPSVTAVTLVSSAGVKSQADMLDLVKTGKADPAAALVTPTTVTAALDAQRNSGAVADSAGTVSTTAKILNSITVASSAQSNPAGKTENFTATGTYSDGSTQDLTSVVTWSSDNTSAVTMSSGVGTGAAKGTSKITASYQPTGSTVTISGSLIQTTTDPVLQSIAVTNTASPPAGRTDQLAVTGTYSDGSTADITSLVTWSSSDTSKVTVSNSGLATGVAKGSATITASITPSGSNTAITGTKTESVLDPTVTNLAISFIQTAVTSIQQGATTALRAVATLSNSATQTVSSLVDWVVAAISGSSGAGTVAKSATDGTVNATLTGNTAGNVSISASYQGVTAQSSLSLAITSPVISGVAASGAPMDKADVTLTCAEGTTSNVTSDSNGAYSINVGSNCSAPYVITASNTVGDSKQTLVSVQPASFTGTSTVNVTTLTHAISATLASNGDPLTLASSIAAEKTNITSAAVTARNAALVASLGSTIAAAGVQGTPNLFSTTFSADRTGLDKVLDNIKVVVGPAGVSITNPAASKVDDMGNNPQSVATDLSSASITINKDTNFSSGLTPLPAAAEDASVVDTVQSALNACFALTASNRVTSTGTLLGACATLTAGFVAGDYKHDGKNLAGEWNRYMTGSAYDGAKFLKPEIIRFYSTAQNDSRALVRFGLQRADGVGEWFTSVAEKSTNTGATWKLRGNQRNYKVFVNGYVVREEQLETRGSGDTQRSKGSYYHSGINLYFGINDPNHPTSTGVSYVRVTGPGLPSGGVYLRYLSGCDYNFAIAASATATPSACTSLYRMQYRKATSADPDNSATKNGFDSVKNNISSGGDAYYAQPMKADADLQAIAPFSAYKFEIFNTGNATNTPNLVYIERLRSRPVALTNSTIGSSEVDKLVFNTGLSSSVKNLIDPIGNAFTGGANFTMSWNNVAGAPPVNSVQVQSKLGTTLYQDETNVRLTATSATLTNSGVAWGNMSQANSSGNYNLVQLRGRDMNDLQYFQNWRY